MYAYLAFNDLHKNLEADLKTWDLKQDRLYLKNELVPTHWAQVCSEIEITPIESIKKAADKLKAINKLWAPYFFCEFRRGELIQEQLTKIHQFKYNFLEPLKDKHWHFWSLLSKNEMIYSLSSTKVPLGEVQFNEDFQTPPSRAYLKLWELFTIHQILPKKTSTAIDFGSSPGGWTWVLSQVCDSVTSVDKARLDYKIERLSNVKFIKGDVFQLDIKKIQRHDWLFCDVICYPEKMLEQIRHWLEQKIARRIGRIKPELFNSSI